MVVLVFSLNPMLLVEMTAHVIAQIIAMSLPLYACIRRCFYSLEAPPARVCGYDTPFPLIFEPLYLPTARRIADAIRSTVRHHG